MSVTGDPKGFYEALNVSLSSSADEIRKAYKKLALRWHPDKNAGNDEATAMFQKISKAYSVLSDVDKKATYDRCGSCGDDNEDDFEGDEDEFLDMFMSMFGGGLDEVDLMTAMMGDFFGDEFAAMGGMSGFKKHLDSEADSDEWDDEEDFDGSDMDGLDFLSGMGGKSLAAMMSELSGLEEMLAGDKSKGKKKAPSAKSLGKAGSKKSVFPAELLAALGGDMDDFDDMEAVLKMMAGGGMMFGGDTDDENDDEEIEEVSDFDDEDTAADTKVKPSAFAHRERGVTVEEVDSSSDEETTPAPPAGLDDPRRLEAPPRSSLEEDAEAVDPEAARAAFEAAVHSGDAATLDALLELMGDVESAQQLGVQLPAEILEAISGLAGGLDARLAGAREEMLALESELELAKRSVGTAEEGEEVAEQQQVAVHSEDDEWTDDGETPFPLETLRMLLESEGLLDHDEDDEVLLEMMARDPTLKEMLRGLGGLGAFKFPQGGDLDEEFATEDEDGDEDEDYAEARAMVGELTTEEEIASVKTRTAMELQRQQLLLEQLLESEKELHELEAMLKTQHLQQMSIANAQELEDSTELTSDGEDDKEAEINLEMALLAARMSLGEDVDEATALKFARLLMSMESANPSSDQPISVTADARDETAT